MAAVDVAPGFGATLKDGFKPVNTWVAGGIAWLDDVQQFYRERSAIEKEYAGKLSALAKKYFEKKAKRASSLGVGETPTVTPGSLESASMTTWTVQLTTLESRASEHDRFAGQLVTVLADPLKSLQTRYEELRKTHADFATKLEKERDTVYSDLRKTKGRYDSVCQEVENRRKKTDGGSDPKSKAQVAYQQQYAEMNNVKNTYLININVANKQKELYYHQYTPELLDSMQDLAETRVNRLNSVWLTAADIERTVMTRSTEYLNHLSAEVPRNDPSLDSQMFLRHNISSWQEPTDLLFEPSPVWLDDDGMVVDESAKNFLRNMLLKSKDQFGEAQQDLAGKKSELDRARRIRQQVREGKDDRDEVDSVKAVVALQEELHEAERKKTSAEVEVSTITQAVGDVSIGAQNHRFKAETFKIPTNCDLCGDRIWGLAAKGFICQDCGYTCHSKCEMKAPADCPGEQSKEDKKRLKTERQGAAHAAAATNGSLPSGTTSSVPNVKVAVGRSDTVNSMNTLSSGYSATAQRSVSGISAPQLPEVAAPEISVANKPAPTPARRGRVVAPPPTAYAADADGDDSPTMEQKGKVLYEYQKSGDGEITVHEGREVVLLEPDDGSGWIKVKAGYVEGIVPASYVELFPPTAVASAHTPQSARPPSTHSHSSTGSVPTSLAGSATSAPNKKKGPAVAPKRGAKKLQYVEALYDYEARSEVEHSIREGERFVLISKDNGDGWTDVEKSGVIKSVPTSYVQEV